VAIASPWLLLIGIAVRRSTRSAALFPRTRAGLRGQPLSLYKFRTMTDTRDALRVRFLNTLRTSLYQRFGKRLFDLLVTVPLLILLSPLMLIIGLCSLLFMGKPLLFRQVRPGFRGQPFTIYKFRTMHDLKDSEGRLSPDGQRLNRFGTFLRRTSLDELPEFWNVLRGDMSLVGPRPLLPEYLPRYTAFQRRRHEVKPGITGWVQVKGRNALTWERKFQMDVWYVDHQSFWLDLRILWLTLVAVLRRHGISQQGHATMPEFLGSVDSETTE
jgi:lipopolysaccharide/colanic/teichoic acid biosynthesis glycosyltransferase